MKQIYLGIDLGAESGRVIAGLWNGKSLRLEELYRFPNGPVPLAGTLRWDVLRLLAESQNGLALAGKKYGRNIVSVGADTWGVDFVLLSKNGELLGQPYHYRDARTNGMMEKAFKKVPRSGNFRANRFAVHATQHALPVAGAEGELIPMCSKRRIAC